MASVAASSPDSPFREYLSGAFAGAANVVTGHPADTVKVRLQSSPGSYHGMMHCARTMMKHEGIRSFYKGMSPPLIGGAVESGINFLVYSRALSALAEIDPRQGKSDNPRELSRRPSLAHVPIAAAGAGVALSVVLGPVELIKCRLQVAGSVYKGPYECVKAILHSEGPWGLTRGFGATVIREVPGNMVYFTVYEACKRLIRNSSATLNQADRKSPSSSVWAEAGATIISGGIAGCVMWAAILPLDAAKTRLQTAHPGSKWDVGVAEHMKMMWKEGGIRVMFSGLGATLIRAFPTNSVQFAVWELSMHLLDKSQSPS